jgi:MFS family permease
MMYILQILCHSLWFMDLHGIDFSLAKGWTLWKEMGMSSAVGTSLQQPHIPLLMPLLGALAAFGPLSIDMCVVSPRIDILTGLRFLEALGGGAGVVIARAIVRDLYDHGKAARVLSLMMRVTALAPLMAPLVGGYLVSWSGRRLEDRPWEHT